MTPEPRWHAAGGGIARCGPYESQRRHDRHLVGHR